MLYNSHHAFISLYVSDAARKLWNRNFQSKVFIFISRHKILATV